MKNQFIAFFIPHEKEYSFDIALKSKTLLVFSFYLYCNIAYPMAAPYYSTGIFNNIHTQPCSNNYYCIKYYSSFYSPYGQVLCSCKHICDPLSCRIQLFSPFRVFQIRHRCYNFRVPAFYFYNFQHPFLQKKNDSHHSFISFHYTEYSAFILP